MRGHKKGVHKVSTKTKKGRKTTIHGGFKAMEHKVAKHKVAKRKRHPRKRA